MNYLIALLMFIWFFYMLIKANDYPVNLENPPKESAFTIMDYSMEIAPFSILMVLILSVLIIISYIKDSWRT